MVSSSTSSSTTSASPASPAASALEWPRFLDYAIEEARTEPGKALIRSLNDPASWAYTLAAARLMQVESQEASLLLTRDALWGPLHELPDPTETLERLGRGAVLEVVDLALLRRWLYAIDAWVQTPREELRGDAFKRSLQQLADPMDPIRTLDRILTPEGELSERASPKLAAIHAELRTLRKEISVKLDHLLKTFSQKGVLQENFTDVRDGRYVLPIKISSQGEVDGIIYEASASRQTVFVEPAEVAPLNNRLRQRQNDLIQEIYVVLQEASKKVHPFAAEIETSVAIVAHWDAVQAKARLARHFGGKMIQVTEDRGVTFRQTAHPLLYWSMPAEQIIRNDVDFGDPTRTLLLTGPNTGGKTVLLKTLGLAGICARTGFPFPATDQPRVPFFTGFFADVGDSQSIERQLSSFSGHVLRFKEILESVDDQSLVLIDELNTATDPEEGAALGRAFLETIMGRGALIVTTTHDPHLKALAVNDKRILNASMAFDEGSRVPTYRIVLGVPGRSRALETAERFGIPASVLDLARSYLSREHNIFERMLAKLETDIHTAERARNAAVAAQHEAERLKKEWTERTQESVSALLDKTRQKLRRVLEQAQDEVRTSVQKLDEMRNRKELDQTRGRLNQAFASAASQIDAALKEEAPEVHQTLGEILGPSALSQGAQAPVAEPTALQPHDTVRIPKWKSSGTVLEISGSKVKVAMGAIQMTLGLSDVERIASAQQPQATSPKKAQMSSNSEAYTPESIDLRGKRFEEAMSELQSYLDLTFRATSRLEVTIIHGLGTGAIREGTRKILGKLPYVKKFHDGGVGRGGSGATVVEFDRD